jgi:hypothetical protein
MLNSTATANEQVIGLHDYLWREHASAISFPASGSCHLYAHPSLVIP